MAEILLGNIKGENGATYTPALDSDGNLSWSNDKGLPNPPTVNIKGPQGPAGEVSGGGGSGDAIPKVGNRGNLAGWETADFDFSALGQPIYISGGSPEFSFALEQYVIVENGETAQILDALVGKEVEPSTSMASWTKVVLVLYGTVELGTRWAWANDTVPTIEAGLLVLHWNMDMGIASFVPCALGVEEIMGKIEAGVA